MSFVFYDTETTGTNAAFDQILQFAAIHTDDDLNEIARYEVRSRLLPYIIPSPGALRVTGLTIDDLVSADHPSHYEMVCDIRTTLAGWCPSAFIGYNSIRFDEEFLRQAFYQCLHPPYLTNTGGSKRADALNLLKSAVVLHPGCIEVPLSEKGRPVFKLDQIAPANGFDHSNAHDALADVEATIFVSRLIKDRCPDLWRRFIRLASKEAVSRFLGDHDAFLLVEPSRSLGTVVSAIGRDPAQSNLVYCWDLNADPRPFGDMEDTELAKALAKPHSPVRKIKMNSAPTLCRMDDAPDDMLEVDSATYVRRAQYVRRNAEFVARVVRLAGEALTDYPPSPFVERQIYDGFWSNADSQKLAAFHTAPWMDRVVIADGLADERLRWLARRLIWVERPDLCPAHYATSLRAEKAGRLLADAANCGGWNTLTKATDELAKLLPQLGADDAVPFFKLRDYVDARRSECEASALGM